ncbi:hypothetical protein SprV_0401712500 [Sparganum proliferum]
MIRALLQDCHLRLRKYNRVLSQAVTKCVELIGEDGVTHLQQVINKRARNRRATRDAELAVKLQIISQSSQEENEVLVHMSSKQLTPAQMKALSHEACFNTTDADPVNLVATVESILRQTGESDETKQLIRQQVTSLAMAHKPPATVTKAEQSALKTLRADTSIVILPADKGCSTVVMDKADYIQKANALLEDRQAYLPCNDEPMGKLVTQLDKTLADMQTSKLAKWMFRNLRSLTSDAGTTVCSATQFLERVKGMRLTEDEVLVSFDVTSLFASIPQHLAVETVSELLESQYDETGVTIKRRHLVQLLRFCLKTYFTFEGTTYEQVKGTPMGSPLAGFIAEAVLQKVETLVFATYKRNFGLDMSMIPSLTLSGKRSRNSMMSSTLFSLTSSSQWRRKPTTNCHSWTFSSIENPMDT